MLDMIGLSDENLPSLVENNPMITVEILMIILKNKNKEKIKRYLRQITNINVTLQSLEGKGDILPFFSLFLSCKLCGIYFWSSRVATEACYIP